MKSPRPATLIAVTLGIAGGIVLGLRPWQVFLQERTDLAEKKQELNGLQSQRATLERESAGMKSDPGMERRVREAGYRKKGEKDLEPIGEPETTNAAPHSDVSESH